MREHSGAEGKNKNRNPTLRDSERTKGQSGEALLDTKGKTRQPRRKGTAQA